jgi:hypothetical protein
MSELGNGPPKEVEAGAPHHQDDRPTTTTRCISGHHTTDAPESICSTGRCAVGELCKCDFYTGWVTDCPPRRTIGEQLHGRRSASRRLPRLACGRRDPISGSIW